MIHGWVTGDWVKGKQMMLKIGLSLDTHVVGDYGLTFLVVYSIKKKFQNVHSEPAGWQVSVFKNCLKIAFFFWIYAENVIFGNEIAFR